MNIKSLCLVGTLFVSVGVCSGSEPIHLQAGNHDNIMHNMQFGQTYNFFVPNVANQTEQNVQPQTDNIPMENLHAQHKLDDKIACIKKLIDISRKSKSEYITIQESKEQLLSMVPEILMLSPKHFEPESSKEFLLELVNKAYWLYQTTNSDPANNPEANADAQSDYVSYCLKQYEQQDAELLLNQLENVCQFVKSARDKGIPKQQVRDELLNSISAMFGSGTEVFNGYFFYIDCLLESY